MVNHNGKAYGGALVPHASQTAITALSGGAATLTLTLPELRTHWFAAVEFYSDAAGTKTDPTAGTATFTIKTPLLPNDYQSITGGVLNFTSPNAQVSWQSNASEIKVVLASISGGSTTHVRLRVYGNVS